MAPNVASAVKRSAPDPMLLFMHTSFSETEGVPNHCRTCFAAHRRLFPEKKMWVMTEKTERR